MTLPVHLAPVSSALLAEPMMLPIGPIHLGALRIDPPVLSAPVAGFTDAIFRGIVRQFGGCGLPFTEMVWAGGWVRGHVVPTRLAGVAAEPRPLGVQLWDRDADMMREAACRLADLRVSVIDLNFGCPKKRIMGRHAAGASLLRDPATVGRLVAAAVAGAGGIPVTAKIRLGPSLRQRTATEVARSAEANGAAGVTVHGRAAAQHYGEPSQWALIREVVEAVSIPVIANGDIVDAESACRALAVSGAAGVMVARGALTRPWVFREIGAALRGAPPPPAPTLAEQRRVLLAHHAAMVAREGDPWGTVQMRKFACRYFLGLPNTRSFRDAIARAADAAEFYAIVDQFVPDATGRAEP